MKGVVIVPFDKEAMGRLFYDEDKSGEVIAACFSDNDYYAMWKTGFYRRVNRLLDIMIDESELEKVSGKEDLQKLYSIILEYEDEIDNPILKTLKSFTKMAIKFDTCVVFNY